MNIKHFTIAPSSLGTLAKAIEMHQLGENYINKDRFDKLCFQLGREMVADLSTPEKAERILTAAKAYAKETAEHHIAEFNNQ